MKDEGAYLRHAIEAIDAITDDTTDGEAAFFADAKTQDAVIRNIEIIAQSSQAIRPPTSPGRFNVFWRMMCDGGGNNSASQTAFRASRRAG